jgi:simple sugar transport system permease protein
MIEFIFSEQFLSQSLVFALPILFAAFAALVSNKVGLLNINIEGSMSVAAVCGALVSHYSGSWALGALCAVAAGIAMSGLLVLLNLRLRTDSVLCGIALNTAATGISVFTLTQVLGVKGDSSAAPSAMIPNVNIRGLREIPLVGKVLFSQNLLFYIAVLIGFALWFCLRKTRFGVHMKAVGHNEAAARSTGIRVGAVKLKALLLCGAMAGLGGAYLSMAWLSYFSVGMVGGRGFIGLAAEAMGGGGLGLTTLFALLFGMADYFAVGAQSVLGIPYELLNTLPYVMTIFAMTLYAIVLKKKQQKTLL